MKKQTVALAIVLSSMSSFSAEVFIQTLESPGKLVIEELTNATNYRVEWAASLNEDWFTLTNIVATGSGSVTVSVPAVYRTVATVVNTGPGPSTNPVIGNMVLIPSGSYVMGGTTNVSGYTGTGDNTPQHDVHVNAFYMESFPVTGYQWERVTDWATTNGYVIEDVTHPSPSNLPQTLVSWYSAVKWCNARSKRDGFDPVYFTGPELTNEYRTGELIPFANWTANGYRLPTEAEWEKAARGGVPGHRFPWTETETIDHSYASYTSRPDIPYDAEAADGPHPSFPVINYYRSPVGYFAPNGYGLYDMAGNVFEWCWDWFSPTYYQSSPGTDPRGPVTGTTKVLRGGSGTYWAEESQVAYRQNFTISKLIDVGFRCAQTP